MSGLGKKKKKYEHGFTHRNVTEFEINLSGLSDLQLENVIQNFMYLFKMYFYLLLMCICVYLFTCAV